MPYVRFLASTAVALSLIGCVGDRRVVATESLALSAADADAITVDVVEGSLDVVGDDAIDEVRLDVELSTHWLSDGSDQDAIDALQVILEEGDAGRLVARVRMPDGPSGYAADVVVRVPSRLAAEVVDTAGDLIVSDVASLDLSDGSGNAEILRVPGAVTIEDGSGSLVLESVGATTVRDGSGDIDLVGAEGDVEVDDEDGDIALAGVTGHVTVRDGSGDLRVVDADAGADLTDDSGRIWLERVRGTTVVRDGSGDIVAIDLEDLRVEADSSGDVDVR